MTIQKYFSKSQKWWT